ncbi:MAG: Integrase [uncultured Chloroflexia bacterium]|uniref:Integrase n=1 Tax=uncultured Chloroflexia bacterium TaxID=1672391 RepID=A0A6J4MPJ9_9CHLR|nr:MAG: Integrase [uncultured Chloroflexia bacterium]
MSDKRQAVQFLIGGGLSVQRACALLSLHRSTFRYDAHPRDDTQTLSRMQRLAAQNPRYGYRRIDALLNQSELVNHKRVKRLWRKHRFQVPRVVRKRLRRERPARLQAAYPGHIWAYDFVEDALVDGRKLYILTVMDEFTREGLALDVALSTSAERVIGVLTALVAQHGRPVHLRSDNGAEFVATAVQLWLVEYGVETLYIEPGKPWQNGKEERFNGTVRDECLNLHVFGSLAEAHVRLSAFREQYNSQRPHSRLGYLTPFAFKKAWLEAQATCRDPLISP